MVCTSVCITVTQRRTTSQNPLQKEQNCFRHLLLLLESQYGCANNHQEAQNLRVNELEKFICFRLLFGRLFFVSLFICLIIC